MKCSCQSTCFHSGNDEGKIVHRCGSRHSWTPPGQSDAEERRWGWCAVKVTAKHVETRSSNNKKAMNLNWGISYNAKHAYLL